MTLSDRLVQIIRWGLVALVAVMPFHAFLSVWLGHLFGHQAIIQSWKEALLVILTGAGVYLVGTDPAYRDKLKSPLIYLSAAFAALAAIITLITRQPLTTAAFGAKTDLEFLVAMALAILVTDRRLVAQLSRVIVATSGAVIAFGLMQIWLLPKDWLTHFGYGASTVQPYQLLDPALPAVRILSTLGGPNQLGSFLILPLALVAWKLLCKPQWWHPIYLLAGLVVMWHTYARSAWIGLAVAFLTLAIVRVNRKWRLPIILAVTLAAAAAVQVITATGGLGKTAQYYLFHQNVNNMGNRASSDEHVDAFKAGLSASMKHPLGEGLGTAGPASFHGSNTFITENYYFQLAVETGLLGLTVFLAICVVLSRSLWLRANQLDLAPTLLGTLIGVSAINLFLHGWSDSSTALIFWTAAGATVGVAKV